MNSEQVSSDSDQSVEEGEIPKEDYDSDDDIWQARLEGPSIVLSK